MSRMATSMRSGSGGGTEPSTRTYSKKWFIDHPILSAGRAEGAGAKDLSVHRTSQSLQAAELQPVAQTAPHPSCAVCASGGPASAKKRSGLASDDAVFGLGDDQVDHVAQIAALFECGELAVGAGIAAHDLPRVVDIGAGAELVDDVVDEFQQLVEQLAERHFLSLSEVDERSAHAKSRRALLVLIEQRPAVEAPTHVLRVEPPELD